LTLLSTEIIMSFMAKYTAEKKAEIIAKVDALRAKGKSVREACETAKAPYPAYVYWDRQRQGVPTLNQVRTERVAIVAPEPGEEVLVLSGSSYQLAAVIKLAQALGAEILTHQIKPRSGTKSL